MIIDFFFFFFKLATRKCYIAVKIQFISRTTKRSLDGVFCIYEAPVLGALYPCMVNVTYPTSISFLKADITSSLLFSKVNISIVYFVNVSF